MKEGNDYLREMLFVKSWCIAILDFLTIKIPGFETFSEVTKQVFIKYSDASSKKMVKGFKECFRDVNGMTRTLSAADYEELNQLLIKEFHVSLDEITQDSNRKIAVIIMSEKINDEEEYKLIENKVDELTNEKREIELVKSLNKLLIAYDS